jgi:hypothetical protein
MEETLKLIDGIQAHGDDWEEIIKVILNLFKYF